MSTVSKSIKEKHTTVFTPPIDQNLQWHRVSFPATVIRLSCFIFWGEGNGVNVIFMIANKKSFSVSIVSYKLYTMDISHFSRFAKLNRR